MEKIMTKEEFKRIVERDIGNDIIQEQEELITKLTDSLDVIRKYQKLLIALSEYHTFREVFECKQDECSDTITAANESIKHLIDCIDFAKARCGD